MVTISKEIYKKGITSIVNGNNSTTGVDIMFQIVNIDDCLFFAREISTGAIFPTYAYNERDNRYFLMTFSFLDFGRNFVFINLDGNGLNKYALFSSYNQKYKVSNIDEINSYLEAADGQFKQKILNLEGENEFLCPLSEIKDKIAQAQMQDMPRFISSYESLYDVSKISEMGYDLATRSNLCHVIGRDEEIAKLIRDIAIKKIRF